MRYVMFWDVEHFQNPMIRGSFLDVKAGVLFKIFDEDGTPVLDDDGRSIFLATRDGYLNGDNVPTVQYAISDGIKTE